MGTINIVLVIVTIFATIGNEVVGKSPLRIVNGTDAKEGEFPYMVQLLTSDSLFNCGGSILGPEWILTAGHCVSTIKAGSIVYGTNILHNDDGYTNTTIMVKNFFQHPKFQHNSAGAPLFDVGILQLDEPIPLDANAQPIKLAEANQDIPFHVQGVLTGWGRNRSRGYSPENLQKINIQLLTDEECTEKINDYSGETSFESVHHICTDNYYNGQCTGDSGSPYVINGIQYGIVSWSYKPCGIIPGAYSRITNPEYRDWIRSITNI